MTLSREDRSFDPTPSFNEATLPRGPCSFFNYDTRRDDCWYPLSASQSGLGFSFAFMRSGGSASGYHWTDPWTHVESDRMGAQSMARVDLLAINRLDEVRTADLTLSREHLNPSVM